MDISRRLFVKTTAVALASAAAAGTMSTLVGCAGGGQTRRIGRRHRRDVSVGVPFLRLRMRRHLRSEGRPAGFGDRRPRQRVEPRAQLRQGLLPGEDPVRRGPSDHAARPRRQGHQGHEGRPARGDVGRGAGPGGRQVEGDLEERQEPPCVLGQRPATHRGRLLHGQVLEGGAAVQQHRPERAPVHGQRRGGLHERVPDRRAGRLLRRP